MHVRLETFVLGAVAIASLSGLLMLACAPVGSVGSSGQWAAGRQEVRVPRQAEPLVREARQLLAVQLGANEDQIDVEEVEARDWPDTSLGCPQEGMAYAQVITPGYRIALEYKGESYAFHTSQSRAVYCPEDKA